MFAVHEARSLWSAQLVSTFFYAIRLFVVTNSWMIVLVLFFQPNKIRTL